MPTLFISYRRDDGGHARALYERLRDWFDVDTLFLDHENLSPGARFRPELDEKARNCQVCLAVIGPHWLSEKNRVRLHEPDDITRGELRAALQAGKPLIPVLAGGADFPPAAALPADLLELAEANAHHQHESQYDSAFITLLDTLEHTHQLNPHYRRRDGRHQPLHLAGLLATPHFSDPAGKLPALLQALAAGGRAALTATTVHGMGGVGKTQLALRLARAHRADYAGIWCFRAETDTSLQEDCLELCREADIARYDNEPPSRSVARWLKQQPRWLLIYDNVDEPRAVLAHKPQDGPHHIVFTTRNPELGEQVGFPSIDLPTWSDEQALDFLRSRLPKASDAERRALAQALGGLPLALEQACAYLLRTNASIADYLAALDDFARRDKLLERQDSLLAPHSVRATLALAFARLSPAAQTLLNLCAWLAPEAIPEFLFTESPQELPAVLAQSVADPLAWGETVAELTGFAICSHDPLSRSLSLHRLTQAAAQDMAQAASQVALVQSLLCAACPRDAELPAHWSRYAALQAHVVHLDRYLDAGWLDRRRHSWLLDQVAGYMRFGPALLADAVFWSRRVLEIDRADLGEEHQEILLSMCNLAHALWARGDLDGALELERSALAIAGRVLGEEHPDTLSAMNNLASTLQDLDDLEGALELQKSAMEIRRRVLGEEHPDTLTSMNNLATVLQDLDDLDGALELHKSVLEIRRRVLGKEHPNTLTSMSNFAEVLQRQGDLTGALDLQKSVLAIRRRVFGEAHPSTLISAWNLFITARQLEDADLCRKLLQTCMFSLLRADAAGLPANSQNIRQQLLDNRVDIEAFTGLSFPIPPSTTPALDQK